MHLLLIIALLHAGLAYGFSTIGFNGSTITLETCITKYGHRSTTAVVTKTTSTTTTARLHTTLLTSTPTVTYT